MAYASPPGFRFGQKLTIVLLLTCVAGFVLAMVERRPWMRVNTAPPVPEELPVQPDPPVSTEEPEKEDPGPASPFLAGKRLDVLFKEVDLKILRAEYDAAAEQLDRVKEIHVAQKERRATLRSWKSRVRIFRELVRETRKGRIIPMPGMTRLELKNGGKIVARSLLDREGSYSLEEITGIRSRIDKGDVARIKKLDPRTAFWEIWEKLKVLCAPFGIEARDEKENDLFVFRFELEKGRSVSGERFFALADFCVSNGANRLVTTLFDEALKRDRNLVKKMHEKKGDRLVSLLLYFLSVPSPADVEYLFNEVLQPRYSDTGAFRERLRNDPESLDRLAMILEKPVDLEPDGKEDPPASPGKPATEESLPEATPDGIRKTIHRGDEYYREAMKHLLRSDPSKSQETWGGENRKALDLFRKAAGAYAEAQEGYEGTANIPSALLNRFRETQIRISLCRKRSVSGR